MAARNKTVKEWLETLPDPYNALAVENALGDVLGRTYRTTTDSLSSALSQAFVWDFTLEGRDFWAAVYDNAKFLEDEQKKNSWML